MLRQAVLPRFEPVVARFGPRKVPKWLVNGPFLDQQWVKAGTQHIVKARTSRSTILCLYRRRVVAVQRFQDPCSTPLHIACVHITQTSFVLLCGSHGHQNPPGSPASLGVVPITLCVGSCIDKCTPRERGSMRQIPSSDCDQRIQKRQQMRLKALFNNF